MNAPATIAPDRTHFLGGSDTAAVLGISPWKTPLQLWQQKTQPFDEPTDPQRQRVLTRGKRMEPYVVDLLAEETGLQIVRRGERYIDREHGFLAAEIDAEAASGENVEIKTVSPFKAKDWGELGTDAIPVYYTAQAMHGLMITGRDVCIFGVLIGGDDFRVYRVERDDETIAAIREREVRFWRDHVEARVAPEPMSAEDLALLFPRDIGTAVEADTETLVAWNELREAKARVKSIECDIEVFEETIKRRIGAAARLTLDGRDIASWKSQTARRFDQAAFKAAQPAVFEQFMKTTECRVLRLK